MKLPSWHASGDRDKAWKNSMGGLGRRLLAGMGWKEGQTLGKRGNENGLVKCLQPDAEDLEKRVKGIGADKSIHSSNWWEQAFNTAAVSIVGKKSKSSSKKRKAEKEAKKKEGKKIKSKPKTKENRDGTETSATADELRIVDSLSKDSWGRWGGREGKMERIRRQEQEFLASQGERDSAPSSEGEEERKKEAKRRRKAEKKRSRSSAAAQSLNQIERCDAKSKAYSLESWWGHKVFSFSGVLGRLERQEGDDEASGAPRDERDQVKAFFKAKENAAQGKAGIGSQFLDIKLGEEYRGQKLTFAEGDAGKTKSKKKSKKKSNKGKKK